MILMLFSHALASYLAIHVTGWHLCFPGCKVVVEKRQLWKLGVKKLLMTEIVSFKEWGRQSC